ncbi:CBS domain-containing protein [Lactobacillus nasalidis]|uniref:CBS domain-containing protein n=1 Tax=Lactobacillus nasalidis TaxID=2797258 RepID=A0ABQ3W8W8_9LACO|nr:cyclic-di-AMP-binding protein CbpB [Lactobacillus nasalidis]GHV97306.1 CBS domain-containing protein [Lactobacillus nasalidis]GHV99858.1 CBS domain-containing protein [Lactobacillus nasalidis]GHW01539.1 CBS domain-containing protein [Lactobacillus nasalidis]
MISAAIQRVIEDKSGSFLIPASKIAFVEEDNPLYHAFLILTKVKYAKIPVLNQEGQITGLLSLAMITDKMLELDGISTKPLNHYKVKDVMQTDFVSVNFTEKDLETQLHLLVDHNFLPVVDDRGVFQGMITRREWFKAFNYLAHTFDDRYVTIDKKQPLRLQAGGK